jgi:L-galactose dehydrogenase
MALRACTIARRGFSSAQPSIADLVARIEMLEGEIAGLRPKMAMTKLGKTNLNVSRVSLGCAPLGGVYGGMDLKKAQSLVDYCFASGINFFDTSPYYGDTKSESVLGHCLHAADVPRDEYVIATKVGRYGDFVDFSPERVTASVEESLSRLQTDYIDVIQCHDIEFAASMEMVINETLPALAELKRKGKVRHIGITGLPLSVMDFVLDRVDEVKDVEIDTVLTYCCGTLNNNQLPKYLPRWKHRHLGIIQGGAASMGLLTPQGPQDWHPAPRQIRDACRDFVRHVEGSGHSVMKLAFQYTYAEKNVHSLLIGPTEVEHLRGSLEWAKEPLNESDRLFLDEASLILAPIKNKVWVEEGSEENIALASAGFWAEQRDVTQRIEAKNTSYALPKWESGAAGDLSFEDLVVLDRKS